MLQDLFNKSRKVPFSDFVTYALYSENGYYRKGSHVEKNGDFLTSPLVSRAYGETLASFFLTKVIHNRSDKISLVELGPNDGRLMSSVVDYIKKSAPNIYQKLEIEHIQYVKLLYIKIQSLLNILKIQVLQCKEKH